MNNRKKIAVCAICRNEKDYVEEWVAFYKVLGFDSVYIYDNVSDDGTSELLLSLDAAREIKRIHWPRVEGVPPQRSAYSDFINRFAMNYDYVLICDLDEFLAVEGCSVKAFLDSAESQCSDVGAIAIPWLIFGSGGAESQQPGLVIERFTQCERQVSTTVKTIFSPSRTYNMRTHICDLISGSYLNNELELAEWDEKMPIRLRKASAGRAIVHHYYTKSREEWVRRRAQPKADRAKFEIKKLEEFERYNNLPSSNVSLTSRAEAVNLKIDIIRSKLSAYAGVEGSIISLVTFSKDWIFGVVDNIESPTPVRVRLLGDGVRETFFDTKPTSKGVHAFAFKAKWLGLYSKNVSLGIVGANKSFDFSLDNVPDPIRALDDLRSYFPNAEEHNFSALMACIHRSQTRDAALSASENFEFTKYPKMSACLKSLRTYFIGSRLDELKDFLKTADDEIKSSLHKIDSEKFIKDLNACL